MLETLSGEVALVNGGTKHDVLIARQRVRHREIVIKYLTMAKGDILATLDGASLRR